MVRVQLQWHGQDHAIFHDDMEREHDGLLAEIFEPERVASPLEEHIVSANGLNTETAVKILMTSGSM
jgi:hypothetical protein